MKQENSKIRIQYANPIFGTAMDINHHAGDVTRYCSRWLLYTIKLANTCKFLNHTIYNDFDFEPLGWYNYKQNINRCNRRRI